MSGPPSALAAGAGVGLIISLILLRRGIIPLSFAQDAPLLEHERDKLAAETQRAKAENREPPPAPKEMSRAEIRAEIRKEMLFLIPPLLLGGLWVLACWKIEPIGRVWTTFTSYSGILSVGGFLGALLGALMGGFVVWITRILGTLAFGREAMGLGDVHLMFGVGAVIGAGASVLAFFVAPFFGLVYALAVFIARRKREVPYGPYLSMGAAFAMLFYCPIARAMSPGLNALFQLLRNYLTGSN
jgi:leader peptidase (prepilin peptidase)/N-methyltransferase